MARTRAELTAAEMITVGELESIANNSIIYKGNTGVYTAVALGTSGKVLTSNGAAVAPTFETNAGGDVTGPAGATADNIATFNGATGKLIKDGGTKISDLATVDYVDGGSYLYPPIYDFYDPTGGLPVGPTVGDRYISEATANGWTEDYIYEWDGASWVETTPEEGWMVWELLGLILWVFFSGGWMESGSGTYLPLAGGTMTGDILGAVSIGETGTRITKGWFTDLEVTNAIAGSVTGNAGTVSTITGLAPDTATTQATQPNITSLGTLTGLTMGGTVSMVDNIVERAVLKDYGETVNAIGDLGGGTDDIDLESGNVISATVSTGEQTFTFSNPPASGKAGSITLFLTNGGSQTVNRPASVDWAGGTAPSLTSSGVDVLTFTTIDGGTIWYGFAAGLDMQ